VSVILILIGVSLGIALLFLAGFIWAVRSGQFEDTCTPSLRVLADEEPAAMSVSKPATKPISKSP
jgi:cbb3-type cytochrome oxidase maturation protein